MRDSDSCGPAQVWGVAWPPSQELQEEHREQRLPWLRAHGAAAPTFTTTQENSWEQGWMGNCSLRGSQSLDGSSQAQVCSLGAEADGGEGCVYQGNSPIAGTN